MYRFALLFLALLPVWAQNSITVTASRSTGATADLAVLQVDVLMGLDSSRDDALAVVQSAGLTSANFSNVRTTQQYLPTTNGSVQLLDWTFTVPVPFRDMKNQVAKLTKVQQDVAQQKNGTSVSFSVQGTQVSSQAAQNATCSTADLLADAKAQALKLASASGNLVGPVLAIAGSTYSPGACTMTVKFALVGAQ